MIEESIDYAKGVAGELGLPFVGSTIPDFLLEDEDVEKKVESSEELYFPVKIYVRAPWE